ncbi:hypothetical protein R84B8_02253 [Treponema sp. R8-4-B8]
MRRNFRWVFGGICAMLAMAAVFGAVIMLLWNALLPMLFSFPQISYLQAAGLLILARLLFGGIGGHGGHKRAMGDERLFHGNKLREKWMNMSEEERKEFMEKEKDFFKFHKGFSRFNGCFDDEETKQNDKSGEKKDDSGE